MSLSEAARSRASREGFARAGYRQSVTPRRRQNGSLRLCVSQLCSSLPLKALPIGVPPIFHPTLQALSLLPLLSQYGRYASRTSKSHTTHNRSNIPLRYRIVGAKNPSASLNPYAPVPAKPNVTVVSPEQTAFQAWLP